MPFELEYLRWGSAALLFAALAAPVVFLGVRSLAGVGAVRRWVSIGLRLTVLLLAVLILAGLRVRRTATDLQVVVLRDVSPSVGNVTDYAGRTVQSAIDRYVTAAAGVPTRPPSDQVGQVSFDRRAYIDRLPTADPTAVAPAGAIHDPVGGTDLAAAIQLGLVTFGKDSRRRLVLISDGNATTGETDRAVSEAVAEHVPIDVVPLHYDVQHEVLMDRFQAPTWRRENEPLTLSIVLKNTNDTPAGGTLTVLDQRTPIDLDPATPGVQPTRRVVIPAATPEKPGLVVEQVSVPAPTPGVHQWYARFDPDRPAAGVGVASTTGGKAGPAEDTLDGNNGAEAFTYVRGKGRLLFVDNVPDNGSARLLQALHDQGIEVDPQDLVSPAQMPSSLLRLQQYDAVVLANVPYGADGGLSDEQQRNLTTYVEKMGGGLVMIGGPDAFGAGGWQGKKLEEILPVDMEVPAQRQIPKGALVLAMDPAEIGADGNYWGEQCAIKACETLSSKDDVGLISYGQNGYTWDFPLGPKGDGSKVTAAARNWSLGDLPSFDEVVNMALDGDAFSKGLIGDDAAQKHIIIITDDDPQMPTQATLERCKQAHVSISTVTVYPHVPHNVAPGTLEAAKYTGGRSFGPIEDHPDRLPQIFIKEATVVRRTLISEKAEGIPLTRRPSGSDIVKGIDGALPPVLGLVLTSKKSNPQVQVPITAGENGDPLLAAWQTGLGRVVCYTSDATNKWGVRWVASPDYDKFWAQLVRSVARPPMSDKFDVSITQQGDKGHVVVEGVDKDGGFAEFMDVSGPVIGPGGGTTELHLVQTGPGRYETTFDMPDAGTYVPVLQYKSPTGEVGNLPVGGISQNAGPEMRDLHSNDAQMASIATRTGGRVLPAFDAASADLFARDHLPPAVSRLPIWDRLIPVLLGLILIDVAARRVAWDWAAVKGYAAHSATLVRSFTTVSRVESRTGLDALQRVRDGKATTDVAGATPPPAAPARPDPKAKFAATGVDGDIAAVVGGAADKPIPSAPKAVAPKGAAPAAGSAMSSLMEAKRRAQQRIDEQAGPRN